jgi:hypothetical protein
MVTKLLMLHLCALLCNFTYRKEESLFLLCIRPTQDRGLQGQEYVTDVKAITKLSVLLNV